MLDVRRQDKNAWGTEFQWNILWLPHLNALRDFGGHGTKNVIQVQGRDDMCQGETVKNLKIKIQVEVIEC